MSDQSQPTPRAECDACGGHHSGSVNTADLGLLSFCNPCGVIPFDTFKERVRARRRSLQEAAAPAVHEFKPGDHVEGTHVYHGAVSGFIRAAPHMRAEDGKWILWNDLEHPTWGYNCTDCRLIRPAPSAQPESFRQTVKCDDCGATLDAITACKRTRVVNGRNEYVPGTFCATCTMKANEQPRRDPYRAVMIAQCQHMNADLLRGECPDCGASSKELIALRRETESRMVNHLKWHDEQSRLMAARAAKQAQALAALDRPIRTGPCGTRDKYGQKLSLRGWDSSDVDELGCA